MLLLNLRTGTKLLLAFAVVTGSFVGLLYLGQDSIRQMHEKGQAIDQLNRDIADVKDLRINVNTMRAEVMAVLIRGDGRLADMERDFQRRTEEDRATLARLQARAAASPTLAPLIAEIHQLWLAYVEFRDQQIVPRMRDGRLEEARQLATGQQAARVEEFRLLARRLDAIIERELRQLDDSSRALVERQQQLFLGIGGGLLLLTVLLAGLLTRSIARPLGELTRYAEQISVGELPGEIGFTGRHDEVGQLGQSFARMAGYLQRLADQAERLAAGELGGNMAAPCSERDLLGQSFMRMVANLRSLVQEMHEGIAVLAAASEEILSVASQVAAGAQETATAVTEIATTVDEVKQTAVMANGRARQVTEAAAHTRQVAQQGREAVQQSLESMAQIRGQVSAVAESIMRLGEQSQTIGEIVATVNDLAEQSNLLGVNASIEAVKAGEAGKGFSVVAQEVKALAEQSKQATAQVRAILGDVQRAMTKAVLAAEQSGKAVEAGYERSQFSGEAIHTLTDSIDTSNDVALQISATSQQQLTGMDQVASAIDNIRQASQDNVAGTRQVDQAARNLHQLGTRLKAVAGQFKL
ncbi:methyl-accepting chemotaxis protein [Pseudogulbenkiania sp. MAI-1]|uniref:methyl-accepting chemotaxis protein n=1 Tax=Pseudogulbenkiania sp. MAI-1 TaxID=990370 RepID=UPI00045E6C53|nr:HAMP domain-containing methyl-accepting chemotaxis protein [Pseudogulbenkiania sp. MAI-1]